MDNSLRRVKQPYRCFIYKTVLSLPLLSKTESSEFLVALLLTYACLAGINNRHRRYQQEAQLPRRNRASAVHFFVARLFSIAVITEIYVRHVRNPRPINRLIYYAHSE